MFENLSDKLQRVFKNLRGEGKLTAENMESALREIRVALLEADVHFRVAKQFIEAVKEKAMGQDVMTSLSPTQQFVHRPTCVLGQVKSVCHLLGPRSGLAPVSWTGRCSAMATS